MMHSACAADAEISSAASDGSLPSPPLSTASLSSGTLTPMPLARPPFETATSYSPRCEPPIGSTMRTTRDDAASVKSARSSGSIGSAIYAPTSPPTMPCTLSLAVLAPH